MSGMIMGEDDAPREDEKLVKYSGRKKYALPCVPLRVGGDLPLGQLQHSMMFIQQTEGIPQTLENADTVILDDHFRM